MQAIGNRLYWQERDLKKLQTYGTKWVTFTTNYHPLAQNMACLFRQHRYEYVYPYAPDDDQVIFVRCRPDSVRALQRQAFEYIAAQQDWAEARLMRLSPVDLGGTVRF